MFKVEFITREVPSHVVLLCNSTRHLAEHNLRLNGRRIVDVVDLVRADYAKGFFRGNRRNTLSFDVQRDSDLDIKPFPDPEGAFAFALDHGDYFDSEGLVRITLEGIKTSATRWLDNAFVEAHDLSELVGVSSKYSYTINCGRILTSKPE